jgi:hypothetical protein
MWFSNHTRGASVSKTQTKVLNLQKKKPKKLQPTQAYSQLFNEGQLKAIIEQRWIAHIAIEPGDASKNKKPTLQFCNKIIKELYDSEPAEIKAQVEAYRETFVEDEVKDDEDEDDPEIDMEEAQRRAKVSAMQR